MTADGGLPVWVAPHVAWLRSELRRGPPRESLRARIEPLIAGWAHSDLEFMWHRALPRPPGSRTRPRDIIKPGSLPDGAVGFNYAVDAQGRALLAEARPAGRVFTEEYVLADVDGGNVRRYVFEREGDDFVLARVGLDVHEGGRVQAAVALRGDSGAVRGERFVYDADGVLVGVEEHFAHPDVETGRTQVLHEFAQQRPRAATPSERRNAQRAFLDALLGALVAAAQSSMQTFGPLWAVALRTTIVSEDPSSLVPAVSVLSVSLRETMRADRGTLWDVATWPELEGFAVDDVRDAADRLVDVSDDEDWLKDVLRDGARALPSMLAPVVALDETFVSFACEIELHDLHEALRACVPEGTLQQLASRELTPP